MRDGKAKLEIGSRGENDLQNVVAFFTAIVVLFTAIASKEGCDGKALWI